MIAALHLPASVAKHYNALPAARASVVRGLKSCRPLHVEPLNRYINESCHLCN